MIQPESVLFHQTLVGVDRDDIFVFRQLNDVVVAIAADMRNIVQSQDQEWLRGISKDSVRLLFDQQPEQFPERSFLGRFEPVRMVAKRFLCFALPPGVYKPEAPVLYLENGVLCVTVSRSPVLENQTFF